MTLAGTDRRTALKARHRAAILEAAQALLRERDGARFTVDELADRADVARRTVFNHFGSSGEVLVALTEELVSARMVVFLATAATRPQGRGDKASMFEDIAFTLRESDLAPAIAAVVHLVSGLDAPHAQAVTEGAFSRAVDGLYREGLRRNPNTDTLEAEVLVSSLMSGVVVIAKRWIARTGAIADAPGRIEWDALLTALLNTVRAGYRPE
jgi:TetR/AcrR family transcriptional regulator, regulator of autoinduction and epiphytic fitness